MKNCLLQNISQISQAYGGAEYVIGGGGNSSVKNDGFLWVKPSGTTLAEMAPGNFVKLDREKLARIYEISPPAEAQSREQMVKEAMMAAITGNHGARPSVEAPLHNAFDATYVLHTHPALANGMTCAVDGEKACRRLFADALWIPYCDPGYTLSMRARHSISLWRERHGAEPSLVFLENHGVFIAADTPRDIHDLHRFVMDSLRSEYKTGGIPTVLAEGPPPDAARIENMHNAVRATLGPAAEHIVAGGAFPVAEGPLSPDHMVYARSFPLVGEPNEKTLQNYLDKYGYPPRIIACTDGVFAVAPKAKLAGLALEFARDAALVTRLTRAFGGTRFVDDEGRKFIENWEVEAYRSKVASG